MTSKAKRMRKLRADRLAAGLCAQCPGPLDRAHSVTCSKCAARNSALQSDRKVRNALAGMCGQCSRPAIDGMSMCDECRTKNKLRQRRRRRNRKGKLHTCGHCKVVGHNRRTCPDLEVHRCECGAEIGATDRACDTCIAAERDYRITQRHPAVRALFDLGRATMDEIANAAGMKRNTAEVALYRYRTAGIVETLSDDEHDLAETLWRVAR